MDVLGWLSIVGASVMSVGAFMVAYFNNATRLMKRVDELTTKVFVLQDESASCRQREADLKMDLDRCASRIRALESFTGSGAAPSTVSGIIVADLHGVIKEFSPAVTPILHYLPKEVVGKPISVLVPRELQQQHKEGFARAVLNPTALDSGRELLTYALNREGEQVPVGITLHGWRTGEEGLITATIRQRAASQPPSGKLVDGVGVNRQ